MPILLAILLSLASCFGETTVKAADIIKKLENGESVEIKDAIVEGILDFSNAGKPSPVSVAVLETRIEANFFCLRCTFKDKVIAQKSNAYTRFDGNLIFLESEFQKEVDFSNAVIFGAINFSKSTFKENAAFNHISVWSRESHFIEISANKKLSFDASTFHGDLSFFDAKLQGSFSLQEVYILGTLQSAQANFGGKTDFAMLKTGGRAIFRYAKFKYEPDFSGSSCEVEGFGI